MTYFFDAMLRGATVGILLLIIAIYVQRGRGISTERLGVLFCASIAAYTIVSLPVTAPVIESVRFVLVLLALFAIVFFWWFALAILQDDTEWSHLRWVPFILIALLTIARFAFPDLLDDHKHNILHQLVAAPIILHVLWLCVTERKNDLVEIRRLLRLILITLIGLFAAVVVVSELIIGTGEVPQMIVHLQSIALFLFTISIAGWALQPTDLFGNNKPLQKNSPNLQPADQAHFDRLIGAMADGVYLKSGLTIKELAIQLNIPEHRLRRLINNELGFQNFASFLNSRRIADAKSILSDLEMVEKQITLIALDLGYGSIGPFNRAFKADTGITPSEYRQDMLSRRTRES
ncbi:MAG: helix-turn-helix domain-containing protein [Parasphingorhabdus sp.]